MGLEGQFVDCPPTETDPGACPDAEATATISLARRDDGIVEIGVRTILPDGLELSRHVRVLAHDGGDDPAVLAVRAVELLRDLRLTGQRPPPRRPTGPARDDEEPKIPPPPPPPSPRAGASRPAWLCSASPASDQPGVGPALGLAIGAGAVVGPRLLVFASFAGPFNTSLSAPSNRRAEGGGWFRRSPRWSSASGSRSGPLEPFVAVLTGRQLSEDHDLGRRHRTLVTPGCRCSAWAAVSPGAYRKRFYFCFDAEAFVTQPDMLV